MTKESALTIVGLPTGLKRAYDVVKPYNMSTEAKAFATLAISPFTFAIPEAVNTFTSFRDGKPMTAMAYMFSAGVNILTEVINGVRAAELAVHIGTLAQVDPTLAGVVGFAVGAIGSRIYNNVMQNAGNSFGSAIESKGGADLIESSMVSANSTINLTTVIVPTAIAAI